MNSFTSSFLVLCCVNTLYCFTSALITKQISLKRSGCINIILLCLLNLPVINYSSVEISVIQSNKNFGPIAVGSVNICEVDKLKSPSSCSNVGKRRHAQEIMNKYAYTFPSDVSL